ncbi:MAG: elongation factor P lysine(34) lysyltransferase [Pasteurellales bacterium]|nr:MAG: elongation factor P lysine(34) lysyltransferase [Pasteurellales bacterium]
MEDLENIEQNVVEKQVEIDLSKPSADIETLVKRASILKQIRAFFENHGVLEVETPILSEFGVTDLALNTFNTDFKPPFGESKKLYLSTSAEYAMKRLLSAGIGPIYQISKVFRNEEQGQFHNPEFTMLEWYRPHFSMFRLIDEVEDLMQAILDCNKFEKISYQSIFQKVLKIDPLTTSKLELVSLCQQEGLVCDESDNRDTLLQFLFTTKIETVIGKDAPCCVYHFPSSQAALARISTEDHRICERFEVYYKGVELANGFHELIDAGEQRRRFESDNFVRQKKEIEVMPLDERFLSAMEKGMPDSSGVALGLDRLIMIALEKEKIKEVLSFDIERA